VSLEANALPTFAGHQTFHPRFGWLKKGLDAVANDPEIFSREDAPVILGVGKNMVEAIRFWCLAFKVITNDGKSAGTRASRYSPTGFGDALLGDSGLDPYLEDATSLWILHWMLCSPNSMAPAWWLLVNEFSQVEFTDESLSLFLKERVDSSMWKTPSQSSIDKDVDALLRMYTRRNAKGRQTVDDLLDSPFRDLGLILESSTRSGSYRINGNSKPTLTSAAVILATLDYMSMFDPDAKTISFTRLAYEENSPGRLFRIPLQVIATLIEQGVQSVSGLTVASPGGVQQLVLNDEPSVLARAVVSDQYATKEASQLAIELVGVAGRASIHGAASMFEVFA